MHEPYSSRQDTLSRHLNPPKNFSEHEGKRRWQY